MTKVASGAQPVAGVARVTRNAIIAPGRHGAPDGKSVVSDVSVTRK